MGNEVSKVVGPAIVAIQDLGSHQLLVFLCGALVAVVFLQHWNANRRQRVNDDRLEGERRLAQAELAKAEQATAAERTLGAKLKEELAALKGETGAVIGQRETGAGTADDFYQGQLLINRLADLFDPNVGYTLTMPERVDMMAILAVMGRFNVGKTFIVNAIAGALGLAAMQTGDDIHTQGISFKMVDQGEDVAGHKMLLDSEGADTSVTRFTWHQREQQNELMTGELLQECASVLDFQRNVMSYIADGIMLVVNQVTCAVLQQICSIYKNSHQQVPFVILVHNLRDIHCEDTLATYKRKVYDMYPQDTMMVKRLHDDNAAAVDGRFTEATYFEHAGTYRGLTEVFLGRRGTLAGRHNDLAIKKLASLVGRPTASEQTLTARVVAAVQQILPQYVELPVNHQLQVRLEDKKLVATRPNGNVMPRLIHREVSHHLTREIGGAFAVIERAKRYDVVVDLPGVTSIEDIEDLGLDREGNVFTIRFQMQRPQGEEGNVIVAAPGSAVARGNSAVTFTARMPDVNFNSYTRDNMFVANGQLHLPFLKQEGDTRRKG